MASLRDNSSWAQGTFHGGPSSNRVRTMRTPPPRKRKGGGQVPFQQLHLALELVPVPKGHQHLPETQTHLEKGKQAPCLTMLGGRPAGHSQTKPIPRLAHGCPLRPGYSKPAFPGLPGSWQARERFGTWRPSFLQSRRATGSKRGFRGHFLEQICSEPAFPGLPCSRNAENPMFCSVRTGAGRSSALKALHPQFAQGHAAGQRTAHRQPAQVEPWASWPWSTGNKHRCCVW